VFSEASELPDVLEKLKAQAKAKNEASILENEKRAKGSQKSLEEDQ
jgi:hypothetical protein